MKHLGTAKSLAIASFTAIATNALAHDGHSLVGSHWHATDVAGFAAVAAVIALAVWLSSGGK